MSKISKMNIKIKLIQMQVFNNPLPFHSYKFEDFQKSEMIQFDNVIDGFKYTLIYVKKGSVTIILKQERKRIFYGDDMVDAVAMSIRFLAKKQGLKQL